MHSCLMPVFSINKTDSVMHHYREERGSPALQSESFCILQNIYISCRYFFKFFLFLKQGEKE